MPVLGMAQDHGVLVRWLHRPGDRVVAGTPLMEVETDKAVVEVDAPADGTLSDVTLEEGHEARVGTVIARIYGDGEAPPPPSAAAGGPAPAPRQPGSAEPVQAAPRPVSASAAPPTAASTRPEPTAPRQAPGAGTGPDGRSGRVLASPKARRLARDQRVDLASIEGTGPGGAVVSADVVAAVRRGTAPSAGTAAVAGTAATAAVDGARRLALVADVTELSRLLERRDASRAVGDVAVATVGIALGDHPSFGPSCDVHLVTHEPSGTRTIDAPASRLGSTRAVGAARASAAAGRDRDGVAHDGADRPDDPRTVVVHDLTGYPATKEVPISREVEVTVGRVVQGPVVRAGALVVGVTLPVQVAYAPAALAEGEALDLLLDVIGLLEEPTGLVMRHRG